MAFGVFSVKLAPIAVQFLGVGHNPEPLTDVRGIDGTSRNTKCDDFVAKTFQVSQHLVEPQPDEARHVLTKEPSGLDDL
jgi:hypothetical protein